MVVREIISKFPGLGNVDSVSIERRCLDREISIDGTYESSLSKRVDLVIADLLFEVANHPDFSEGDLSENYDRETLLKSSDSLRKKYGLSSLSSPKIRNRTNVW